MIKLRTAVTLGCLSLTLLLAGCSSDKSPSTALPSEVPSARPENKTDNGVVVFDYVEEAPVETKTPPPVIISPDPQLMEKMTCDPLPQQFLEDNSSGFGIPLRSVHIKVGQGLTPSEDWWIVVYDSPAYSYSGTPKEIRKFLTTAPSNPQHIGKWIELGNEIPWRRVQWPEKKLVIAQSALDKAMQCLDD